MRKPCSNILLAIPCPLRIVVLPICLLQPCSRSRCGTGVYLLLVFFCLTLQLPATLQSSFGGNSPSDYNLCRLLPLAFDLAEEGLVWFALETQEKQRRFPRSVILRQLDIESLFQFIVKKESEIDLTGGRFI